jgi:5-methylcytosine-specific restriction protein A
MAGNWDHGTRTTTQRGYGWAHQRMRIALMREVIWCEECRRNDKYTVGTIADHVIPLAKGGTGSRENYQLLCRSCADAKDAKDRGMKQPSKTRLKKGCDINGWPLDPRHPWNTGK